MEPSSKTICNEKRDKFSGLPQSILECILSRMPLCDAVRTSILSRSWRYVWNSIPKIEIDGPFFEDMVIRKKNVAFPFPELISLILFMHEGPIVELFLPIPDLPLCQEMDRWLLVLSRKGIERLTLRNISPTTYKLPSSIILCKTLTYMSVSNICIFKPPYGSIGFKNLVELHLMDLSFVPNVSSNLVLIAPKLQDLVIEKCTGIEHLRIHAPKLQLFHVFECDDINWQWFERNQQLEDVEIVLSKEVKSTNEGTTMNLAMFIGSLPKVGVLWLGGFSLKFLAAHHVSPRLPTPPQNMTNLGLWNFSVSDLNQISGFLCLLRSSPNLKRLDIIIDEMEENMVEPVIGCLEAFKCKDIKLENLKSMEIITLRGHKAELLLVKLLLACSPSLKRMDIQLSSKKIDVSERYRISKEIIAFSRASTEAEVLITEDDDH